MSAIVFVAEFVAHPLYSTCRIGILRHAFESLFERRQVVVTEIFEADVLSACAVCSAKEFIEFDLDGFTVAILGVLDEEDHQKGDDSGACIDDKLPSIRIVEEWSSCRPDNDCRDRK